MYSLGGGLHDRRPCGRCRQEGNTFDSESIFCVIVQPRGVALPDHCGSGGRLKAADCVCACASFHPGVECVASGTRHEGVRRCFLR